MLEACHPKMIEKLQKSQEVQKRTQNRRSNICPPLSTGTKVFIRDDAMRGKLSPAYRGPFEVIRMTSKGNYVLKNKIGQRLEGSFPVSKLKVTEDFDVDSDEANEDFFDVEAIRDHRVEDNDMFYLVKWLGFAEKDNSWVSEEDFHSIEPIQRYWKSFDEDAKARAWELLDLEATEVRLRR